MADTVWKDTTDNAWVDTSDNVWQDVTFLAVILYWSLVLSVDDRELVPVLDDRELSII